MRILFDDVAFNQSAFSGVSRYLTQVIANLPPQATPILPVLETSNIYLQAPPFRIPAARISFQTFLPGVFFPGKRRLFTLLSRLPRAVFPSSERRNRQEFHRLLRLADFDILHLTSAHLYGTHWFGCIGRKPIVATIHDVIPEKLQDLDVVKRERARIVRSATRFIAVSETTKRDFMELYKVPEDRIDVVYHGPSYSDAQAPEGDNPFPWPYLLYVGKRNGYKNFRFFARAVAPWLRDRGAFRLVCTGAPFRAEEGRLLHDLGIRDRCLSRFFPEDRMGSVYRHAFAFVYPSRYEGFGIPILDAFAAGCPAVLNRASCFPEIGGDSALFFEDGDESSLLAALDRLENDSRFRSRLVASGKERVRHFSWKTAAERTYRCYERAIRDFSASHTNGKGDEER